jgi:heptaprenyl diphosphate synthase
VINILEALRLPTLADDLVRVEAALNTAMAAEDPFLNEVAGHLIQAGGKRLRPALGLASAAAVCGTGSAGDDVVRGGAAVELVHMGSLYHDDVMDEAATRRGVESVNHRWGNLVAILAGDYLLARASEIAASLGTEVAGLLAATIGRL